MKNPAMLCCYVFLPLLFVCYGGCLAPSEVYRVIALLAGAVTPRALECGLLSCDLISIFIVYQPWGSILAWMLLQMNAITGEPSHPDCIERSGWVGKFSGLPCHLRMEHKHTEAVTEGPLSVPLPLHPGYWHSLLVLCLISLK